MKIKTSELSGSQLDWVVAEIEGWHALHDKTLSATWFNLHRPKYSTDWSVGGPIIEREEIDVYCFETSKHGGIAIFTCEIGHGKNLVKHKSKTILIAAMRCYVASKMGDEVEIPDELLGDTNGLN